MESFSTFLVEANSKDRIRHAVWKAWKKDVMMPAHENHWSELNDDDHDDFEQHVDDVHAHMQKHGITSPAKGVKHYTDHFAAQMEKEYKLRKH